MPPKRDLLANRDLKESLVTFRVDESFSARINSVCAENDLRRSEMIIDALRWYLPMLESAPCIAALSGDKIARYAPKVGKIIVLLDQD